MNDPRTVSLLLADPARRRRLIRRGAIAAARRGLKGPYDFDMVGTRVVVFCDGTVLAALRR